MDHRNANSPAGPRAAAAICETISTSEDSTGPAKGKTVLAYARLGWRMHPCHWIVDTGCSCGDPEHLVGEKAGKHPILEGWPTRASTKPAVIERWLSRWPLANWAVATGHESGLLVLDVDGSEGERSLIELERRHVTLPERYPMQWTGGGRGGWQAFFCWPAGRQIGNSVGRLGPKLDTRGAAGYVLLPPSVTAQAYRWAEGRSPWQIPPPAPPGSLVDLLDPPMVEPDAPFDPRAYRKDDHSGDRYVLRALEAELALIASAPNGRRNDQLNESAFSLFRFVLEGRLDAGAIIHGLEAAGRHAGLSDKEISATISSAARARGITL